MLRSITWPVAADSASETVCGSCGGPKAFCGVEKRGVLDGRVLLLSNGLASARFDSWVGAGGLPGPLLFFSEPEDR